MHLQISYLVVVNTSVIKTHNQVVVGNSNCTLRASVIELTCSWGSRNEARNGGLFSLPNELAVIFTYTHQPGQTFKRVCKLLFLGLKDSFKISPILEQVCPCIHDWSKEKRCKWVGWSASNSHLLFTLGKLQVCSVVINRKKVSPKLLFPLIIGQVWTCKNLNFSQVFSPPTPTLCNFCVNINFLLRTNSECAWAIQKA